MARKSRPTILSELQKDILLAITRRHDSPQQLARRARIVLLAAEGLINPHIATQVGLSRDTVFNWRTRWNRQAEQLAVVEAKGDPKELQQFIVEDALADDPYNGERGKYTPEHRLGRRKDWHSAPGTGGPGFADASWILHEMRTASPDPIETEAVPPLGH